MCIALWLQTEINLAFFEITTIMKYLYRAAMFCETHLAKHLGPDIFLMCHSFDFLLDPPPWTQRTSSLGLLIPS